MQTIEPAESHERSPVFSPTSRPEDRAAVRNIARRIDRRRPVYLNLFRIHLPITGWVSILHRITGALLFLMLPVMVWSVSLALASEAGFARVAAWVSSPFAKFLTLALVWTFAHHFFAGLRHLAMDIHRGVQLNSARRSSLAVLVAAGGVTLLAAWRLFI